jgi:hypothetical protein
MIVDEEVVAQMKNEMKHVAKSFLIGNWTTMFDTLGLVYSRSLRA